jgi:hypothetical protein
MVAVMATIFLFFQGALMYPNPLFTTGQPTPPPPDSALSRAILEALNNREPQAITPQQVFDKQLSTEIQDQFPDDHGYESYAADNAINNATSASSTGRVELPVEMSQTTPVPQPEQHQGKFGLKDRIMHFLKGAGVGFLTGGPVAALASGIGSAASPNFYHNMKHRLQLQNWAPQHQAETAYNDSKLKERIQLATLSGIDPVTQRPTFASEKNDQLMNYKADQLERQRQKDVAGYKTQLAKIAGTAQNAAMRGLIQVYQRGGLDSSGRAELADLLGLSETLREPFINGQYRPQVDEKGNLGTLNVQSGVYAGATDSKGAPVGTIQGAKQNETVRHNKENEALGKERNEIGRERNAISKAKGSGSGGSGSDWKKKAYDQKLGGLMANPKWQMYPEDMRNRIVTDLKKVYGVE